MEKKHAVLCLGLIALLASCSVAIGPGGNNSHETTGHSSSSKASEVEGADDYSYYSGEIEAAETYAKAKAYVGSLNSYQYLPCVIFSFAEDIPYVSVKDYYSSFFNSLFGKFFAVDGDEVVNRNTGVPLHFDVDNNAIWCTDFDQFVNFTATKLPVDAFNAGDEETDPLSYLDEDASTYIKGNKITFNLSAYHAQLVSYQEGIYVPFSFLDTITCMEIGYHFVWNGDAFYLCDANYLYSGSTLTDYGRSFYNGSLNSSSRSQSFADYNYYSFLFQMRNFYGRYYTLGISDLDAEFERLGLKSKLLSRIPKTADEAIATALIQVFADGGHTYFKNRGFGVKYSASEDENLQGLVLDDNRYYKGAAVYQTLSSYRQMNHINGQGLYISGQTALIVFDEFSLNSKGLSPTSKNVTSDATSTFGLFYNAFKSIAKNSAIKNVVFDVSMNGGGAAIALGHALSFITDDAISLNMENPHTGATFKEVIYVDNDFDGDALDEDSYAGKYNFYILTSPYSFSCGNAFPCIAKDNGWAKIIGKKSGGGDCIVDAGVSADGTRWSMSGSTALIHEDGSSFDSGAEVDYELDYSYYYNLSKLNSFLLSKD